METKKNVPFNYIAGGFFAFLALMQLANFHFSVVSVLWLAGDVLLAAALFLKRRDILLSAGGGTPPTTGTAPQQPSRPAAAGIGAAEELKAYKEFLDSGAITQEEFDAKKRQILGL